MESYTKVTIEKIEWNAYKDTDRGMYASVTIRGTQYNCFLDSSVVMTLLTEGSEAEVITEKVNQYNNLVDIKGYKEALANPSSSEVPTPTPTPEAQLNKTSEPTPPPQSQPDKAADTNGGGSLLVEEANRIINQLDTSIATLTEDQLTQHEVRLSAINFQITKHYAVNYKELKKQEYDYKTKLRGIVAEEKAKEKTTGEKVTLKYAEEVGETRLSFEKNELLELQAKVVSNEAILDSVKNVMLAIKDRIKFLRK